MNKVRSKKYRKIHDFPFVSVIVTTKNSEKTLFDCLLSIVNQDYPFSRIELIVVDNNSTDATRKIARRFTNKVFIHGPERSAQRNFGAQKCKGDYYLYIDSDMTLDSKVIRESVEKFKNDPSLVALYIPEVIIGDGFWSQVRKLERSFYSATVIDCVRLIKTDVFNNVGRFDEMMSGPEDWDLDKKIRNIGNVDIINSPIFHNESEFSVGNYLKKKGYYAKSFSTYIQKWGKSDPDIQQQFGILYRLFLVFIEKGKWKQTIRFPHLMIGIIFLRILVGIKYLWIKLTKDSKNLYYDVE